MPLAGRFPRRLHQRLQSEASTGAPDPRAPARCPSGTAIAELASRKRASAIQPKRAVASCPDERSTVSRGRAGCRGSPPPGKERRTCARESSYLGLCRRAPGDGEQAGCRLAGRGGGAAAEGSDGGRSTGSDRPRKGAPRHDSVRRRTPQRTREVTDQRRARAHIHVGERSTDGDWSEQGLRVGVVSSRSRPPRASPLASTLSQSVAQLFKPAQQRGGRTRSVVVDTAVLVALTRVAGGVAVAVT